MKNKYFGYLKELDFHEGNYNDEIEYLIKHSILDKTPSLSAPLYFNKTKKIWIAPINENYINHQYYKLRPIVLQEYYDFLVNQYQENINQPFIAFLLALDERLFGLDQNEQKNIALDNFNRTYSTIEPMFIIPEIKLSKTGIEYLEKVSRFKKLKEHQETLKSAHCIYDKYNKQFLYGNNDFFDNELILDNSNLEHVIKFETKLKILLNLNDRFKFETDYYFGINNQLKKKFERHENISFGFDIFKFIHNYFDTITSFTYVEAVSLYFFLYGNNLIDDDSIIFQNFMNSEFNIKIGRLKINSPDNKKHIERMEKLKNLWTDYSALDS